MMIFPKMLRQAPATDEAEPVPPPCPEKSKSAKLPETWRVVMEDGSTSGPISGGRTAEAGRKLLAEVTDAMRAPGDAKRRSVRTRSVAMPDAPRQSLDALDQPLARPAGARGTPAAGARKAPDASGPAAGAPDPSRGAAPAGEAAEVLTARAGSARRDLDARLARVIDCWPRLPRGIQAAILALIDAEAANSR